MRMAILILSATIIAGCATDPTGRPQTVQLTEGSSYGGTGGALFALGLAVIDGASRLLSED